VTTTHPAFQIPLTRSELATLGELCAIQGQVEHLLIYTLSYVLDITPETARKMLAASSIQTNAETWITIFREKCVEEEVTKTAELAFALVKGVMRGRNDFVHALFATPFGEQWLLHHVPTGKAHPRPKRNGAIAIRTRDMKKRRPISDLIKVRNDAARLSVLLEKISMAFLPNYEDR
jgi:hypothetical protein